MGGSPSTHKIDPKLGFGVLKSSLLIYITPHNIDPNFRQISSPNVARPLVQGDTIIARFVHCVDVYGEDSFMQVPIILFSCVCVYTV